MPFSTTKVYRRYMEGEGGKLKLKNNKWIIDEFRPLGTTSTFEFNLKIIYSIKTLNTIYER